MDDKCIKRDLYNKIATTNEEYIIPKDVIYNRRPIDFLIGHFEKNKISYGIHHKGNSDSTAECDDQRLNSQIIQDEQYIFPSVSKEDLLKKSSFCFTNIDPKNLVKLVKIDEGNFGVVYKGIVKLQDGSINKEMIVAIKEIKAKSIESQMEMKKEAELIQGLNHQYIIKFIGICSEEMSPLKIILEFAELGSLHKYLIAHKNQINIKKLVNYCYQIALAMEYLASMWIVHRDLAARNVLLVSEDVCKVTDFGLSRPVNENKYYTLSREAFLPMRWYPPDIIKDNHKKFDEKSDVWSFGVTCWEVTSFGDMPYGNRNILELLYFLENGSRLEKPERCSEIMYDIILKCWSNDKNNRPKFSKLASDLENLVNSSSRNDETRNSQYVNINSPGEIFPLSNQNEKVSKFQIKSNELDSRPRFSKLVVELKKVISSCSKESETHSEVVNTDKYSDNVSSIYQNQKIRQTLVRDLLKKFEFGCF